MNFTSMDESRSSKPAKKRLRVLKPRHSFEMFTDSDSESDESDRVTVDMEEEGGCEKVLRAGAKCIRTLY